MHVLKDMEIEMRLGVKVVLRRSNACLMHVACVQSSETNGIMHVQRAIVFRGD